MNLEAMWLHRQAEIIAKSLQENGYLKEDVNMGDVADSIFYNLEEMNI